MSTGSEVRSEHNSRLLLAVTYYLCCRSPMSRGGQYSVCKRENVGLSRNYKCDSLGEIGAGEKNRQNLAIPPALNLFTTTAGFCIRCCRLLMNNLFLTRTVFIFLIRCSILCNVLRKTCTDTNRC